VPLRSRVLASVTLWLAAVASIAGITWIAIDAAGRQVTSSSVADVFPTEIPSPGTGSAASPHRAGASPRSSAPGSAHPSSTGANQNPIPGQSSAVPSASSTATTGDGSRVVSSVAISGTYSTAGGRVRVSCRGSVISLAGGYAQPAPGWSVRVAAAGSDQVQVVFDLGDQQALLVIAACVNGQPQFDQNRIEAGSPSPAQSPEEAGQSARNRSNQSGRSGWNDAGRRQPSVTSSPSPATTADPAFTQQTFTRTAVSSCPTLTGSRPAGPDRSVGASVSPSSGVGNQSVSGGEPVSASCSAERVDRGVPGAWGQPPWASGVPAARPWFVRESSAQERRHSR
jgi:hypothetical protein